MGPLRRAHQRRMLDGGGACVVYYHRGHPRGAQCFKYAYLTLMPFGKDVTYCGGPVSFLLNAAWLLLSGIWLAAVNAILGALLTLTVIGIPFGKQFFKIAKLALAPFGTRVS